MNHRLTGEQLAQQSELLVGEPPTITDRQAEVLELLGPVPEGQDVRRPPTADDVEDRHVLGEAYRLVERKDQDQAQAQTLGARGDRGSQHHR